MNHNHAVGPSHKKQVSNNARKIISISAVLIFTFMMIEFIGGVVSKSMALVADSVHMLSDFISLILVLVAIIISQLQNNIKKTYGYSRFEIVISLSNALFLLFICGVIVFEAIGRMLNPEPVDALTMLPVAIAGLLINFLVLYLINKTGQGHGHSHSNDGVHNHNHDVKGKNSKRSLLMEGAFLHVLSDTLGSVAAISAGIIIYFTGWYYIDPILSIFIVLLILNSTWRVIKDSSHILMEGSPNNLSAAAIKKDLEKNIVEVIDVHHIHLWMLNEQENLITLHAVVNKDANINKVINAIKEYLKNNYPIYHSTIQLENEGEDCPDKGDEHY
jgi:cobalt-zinc-cadmium efflux system protein